MRCIAVIDASRPGLDTVIIWDDGSQLLAFAYEQGQVKMTRPLAAPTLDMAVTEATVSFQVTDGHVTRINEWAATLPTTELAAALPKRWGMT